MFTKPSGAKLGVAMSNLCITDKEEEFIMNIYRNCEYLANKIL